MKETKPSRCGATVQLNCSQNTMPTAYIVECARSACGRKGGALSEWHPADLGAAVVDGLLKKAGIAGDLLKVAMIDDVIFGCVCQNGAQAGNVGRQVVLSSSVLPISVPGTTVDRQCGSGQQAIHFAAQAVMSGTQDIVIAGGVEVMSLVPIGSNVTDSFAKGRGGPNGANIKKKFDTESIAFSQFDGAEIVAEKYNISREDMERLAVSSHQRAFEATKKGYFKKEIVPVTGRDKKKNVDVVVDKDEGIRYPTTMEGLGKLKTLKEGGRVTAGVASQIADGAAAVLICNENGLKKLGLTPKAKIVHLALAGTDPVSMLSGPIPATEKLLEKAGIKLDQVDLYEVNEAFACVPLAWLKALKADPSKLNVNGGAMALGHPLGGTGAKLMTTLVHELDRRGGRFGVLAICEGGGTANATLIENLNAPKAKL